MSRSRNAKVRFGGLAEPSFSTPLDRVTFLVLGWISVVCSHVDHREHLRGKFFHGGRNLMVSHKIPSPWKNLLILPYNLYQ